MPIKPIKPYIYVTCPSCGNRIRQPFARYAGPGVFRHSVCNARLLVCPDPRRQNNHQVTVLADDVSYEQALTNACEAA
jgi:hypothetical protein